MLFRSDLLESAGKYNLMVNFHGATIPRGWQRTYPNLMTVEAVYGAEWYNNLPVLTDKAAAHNATLPFTRNVIGSMDYTPCTFTDSQHPHITSDGHELALCVVFESGIQHLADRPESYLSLPQELQDFLTRLPSAWDETRLLSGYPGDYVVLARRKGDKWYVGGLNGNDTEKRIKVDISTLKNPGKEIKLYSDAKGKSDFPAISVEQLNGNLNETEILCLPRGGFVIEIN